ncbi:FAD/NAD(P)-binding domain-containing protein [Lepidopterella palustris CBS 459.81]|uniref:FAD/NAD(P)-binding domain-containing protein n=1 Tax=Lepidopterella palustris CBS 459.81 TaxID=1314670 RepID=A0A8E2EIP4_9PEZI|nr:FAD/NAD(P)-binding domain-containing protein [Lepidopterella palustris CBS 459.81]
MTTETILVLGGSFAGLSAAHYALKHVLPSVPKSEGKTYTVTLVNPSPDFYWRVAGPRACVDKDLLPSSKYLYPIAPAFSSYPKGQFTFILGTATAVDTAAKTATISTTEGSVQTIPYKALIIATGTSTPAPMFSARATKEELTAALSSFQKALPSAKSVIIAGGGPVGVETAGEIAEFLNGTPGFFSSKPAHPKAVVTIISGDGKLLPILRPAISKQAEKFLHRLGAEVIYSTRVTGTTVEADGKTTVALSDGKTMTADIYVDATGVRPNTSYLPSTLLNEKGYVLCNSSTLRVDAAGPLVYVIGDAGSYTRGGVMDCYDAVPVALTNLKKDLSPNAASLPDRTYKQNTVEQQIVPVGRGKGVGAVLGWKVPSWFVWAIKGRDYMCSMAPDLVSGKKWAKEVAWKPQPTVQAKAGSQGGK